MKNRTLILFAAALVLFAAGCCLKPFFGIADAQPGEITDSSTTVAQPRDTEQPIVRPARPVGVSIADEARQYAGVNFAPIYFPFDVAILDQVYFEELRRLAIRLRNNGDRYIIEGHTCRIGSGDYNVALGERRARTVYAYLVAQGVPEAQLHFVSYGEERPAVDSPLRLNRRAMITSE